MKYAHFMILFTMNYKGCGKIGHWSICGAIPATAGTDCKTMQNLCKNCWNPSWDSEWACPEHKPKAIAECSSSTLIFPKHKFSALYVLSQQIGMQSAVSNWYCKNETQNRIRKNRLHKLLMDIYSMWIQRYTSLFVHSKEIERKNLEHASYYSDYTY
jgi:hypothetical protein